MSFGAFCRLVFALALIVGVIALIVAFPWLLVIPLIGSPLFMGRKGA